MRIVTLFLTCSAVLLCLALLSQDDKPERYPWPFDPVDQPTRILSVYHNPQRAELPSAYFHGGVDLYAKPGSVVRAVAQGHVETYFDQRFDNLVLTEADGTQWEYRHIARGTVPEAVREAEQKGEVIQAGAPIGESAHWGYADYDHIHLNRRGSDGAILDPLEALIPFEDTIAPEIEDLLVLPDNEGVPFPVDENGRVEIFGLVDFVVVARDRIAPDDLWQAPIEFEWSVGDLAKRSFAPCRGQLPGQPERPSPRYPMFGLDAVYLLWGPARCKNPTYSADGQRFVSVLTHDAAGKRIAPRGAFDTRTLDDGDYELRVAALDYAANRTERVLRVTVRNRAERTPRPQHVEPLGSPAADDYRAVFADQRASHRFRVRNTTGSPIELRSVKPKSERSGTVTSWSQRTEPGGMLEVEIQTPIADWAGETRTLIFTGITQGASLRLQLRVEAYSR